MKLTDYLMKNVIADAKEKQKQFEEAEFQLEKSLYALISAGQAHNELGHIDFDENSGIPRFYDDVNDENMGIARCRMDGDTLKISLVSGEDNEKDWFEPFNYGTLDYVELTESVVASLTK